MNQEAIQTFDKISDFLKQQQELLGKTDVFLGIERPAVDDAEESAPQVKQNAIPVIKASDKREAVSPKLRIDDKSQKLASLQEKLALKYSSVLIGAGNVNAKLMLLTGMPSPEDIAARKPISGTSIPIYQRMLQKLGFVETEVYVTSFLKYSATKKSDITSMDIDFAKVCLSEQLEIIQPRYIFCFGEFAAQNLLNTNEKFENLHGRLLNRDRIKVFVTYHPRELLKDKQLFWTVFEDMKAFRQVYDAEIGDKPPMK